jgi:hypothetical protein
MRGKITVIAYHRAKAPDLLAEPPDITLWREIERT